MASTDYSLYLVTDRRFLRGRDLVDVVDDCIRKGVTVVQLREKEATAREFLELGRRLHAVTREHGVPLIINDRVDLALAIGAEGVHLGQDDLPLPDARRLIGDRIIGCTVKTPEHVRAAEAQGADYLGVGPAFPTRTKTKAGVTLGPEGIARFVASTHLPCVAIGGINESNITKLRGTGAAGICTASGILDAENPGEAAALLRWLME